MGNMPFPIVPGIRKSPYDARDWQYSRVFEELKTPLPPISNMIEDLPITRNQYSRGTCGGFALIGAQELFEYYETGSYVDLSALAVYLETRVLDNTELGDNDGVHMRSLLETALAYGAPFEADFPYRTNFLNTERPPDRLREIAFKHRIKGYVRCNTLQEIKLAIHSKQPVLVGLFLMSNVYQAINGIVPFPVDYPINFIGGHAMYAVAYDDVRNLLGFRNSWGLGHNQVDDNGITWFPYSYITMVTDFGMPMLLDAFALIDFIPEPDLIKPKIYTIADGVVNVTYNGVPVVFKYSQPFIAKEVSRTFIGLRDLGELFECEVGYDEGTNTVILTKTDKTIVQSFVDFLMRMFKT